VREYNRVSVNLSRKAIQLLQRVAEMNNISINQAFVEVLKFLLCVQPRKLKRVPFGTVKRRSFLLTREEYQLAMEVKRKFNASLGQILHQLF